MSRRTTAFSMGMVTASLCAAVVASQQKPFRTIGHGVRIDVLVTDRSRPVQGLRAADFEVYDMGTRQDVEAVESADHVAVALVVDTSHSVRGAAYQGVLRRAEEVIDLLQRDDRAALLTFADRVTPVVPSTADFGALRRALTATGRFGAGAVPRSTVWDAVFAGAALVAADTGRPLVVLFSDGMDNASWLGKDSVSRTLANLSIIVDFVRTPWDRGSIDEFGPGTQTPEDLPNRTGGLILDTRDSRFRDKLSGHLTLLRHTYVLTYVPRGVATDNGWHDVKVAVRGRDVAVKARPGYYANRRTS